MEAYRIRNGLPHFIARLKSGVPVRIAYFGGSITAAPGGWRDQSVDHIRRLYPQAEVDQFNASIGGTGSDLGVFRLRTDVLIHKPDLIFVEFAVNDQALAPERILRSMEGIVRQVWRENDRTDICFVYTLTGAMAPTLVAGRLTPAMLAMEQVAAHYQIPSIQLGYEAITLFKAGKLRFQGTPEEHPDQVVFSRDNVHPYAHTGQRLYADAVAGALQAMTVGEPSKKRRRIRPLVPDNWEHARMIPAAELAGDGEWQLLSAASDPVARRHKERFGKLLKSTSPGAALHLSFNGRVIGMYDIVGPGCGQFKVTIDGRAPTLHARFDKYSSYYRPHYFFLPEMTPGNHSVKWEVSGKKLDKKAILSEGTHQFEQTEKFASDDCYAGYVLLIGKLREKRRPRAAGQQR